MILAVTGTRKLSPKMTEYAKVLITHEVISGRWDSVVTGALLERGRIVPVPGIDALAKKICDAHGIPCKLLVAEVAEWDHPQGLKARDTLIAQTCDAMLCLRHQESETYGSGWTADHCKKLGKPVYRVEFR